MTGGLAAPQEITCREVSKVYPGSLTPAVDRVSLRIPAGSFSVLLGPSGCGKTTLLKMINRLVEPSAGEIRIGEAEIHDLPAVQLRRQIGYVIQQVGLFPHMSVAENIAVVPRLEGWNAARIQERVRTLLEMVELPDDYAQRRPRQLSGGEQQRVGLARALAADPGILLMDEPFGALDTVTRRNLQEQLMQIQRKVGKTVLFVTHDVEEAIRLADQILVMRAGQLVQAGTPVEVISQPQDEFVARLVDSGNLLQRLSVLTAADVLRTRVRIPPSSGNGDHPSARIDDDLRSILSLMLLHNTEEVRLRGADGQPAGSIHFRDLRAVMARPD